MSGLNFSVDRRELRDWIDVDYEYDYVSTLLRARDMYKQKIKAKTFTFRSEVKERKFDTVHLIDAKKVDVRNGFVLPGFSTAGTNHYVFYCNENDVRRVDAVRNMVIGRQFTRARNDDTIAKRWSMSSLRIGQIEAILNIRDNAVSEYAKFRSIEANTFGEFVFRLCIRFPHVRMRVDVILFLVGVFFVADGDEKKSLLSSFHLYFENYEDEACSSCVFANTLRIGRNHGIEATRYFGENGPLSVFRSYREVGKYEIMDHCNPPRRLGMVEGKRCAFRHEFAHVWIAMPMSSTSVALKWGNLNSVALFEFTWTLLAEVLHLMSKDVFYRKMGRGELQIDWRKESAAYELVMTNETARRSVFVDMECLGYTRYHVFEYMESGFIDQSLVLDQKREFDFMLEVQMARVLPIDSVRIKYDELAKLKKVNRATLSIEL